MFKRKRLRKKDHDYSEPGLYFITINTYHRKHLLAEEGRAQGPAPTDVMAGPCAGHSDSSCPLALTDVGLMVQSAWLDIPKFYHGVELDEFVVMPNHVHGIITLRRPQGAALTSSGQRTALASSGQGVALTLSDIVGRFKSLTTTRFRKLTQEHLLWQRGFYDHIIRGDEEWYFMQEYILNNPANWERDKLYVQKS